MAVLAPQVPELGFGRVDLQQEMVGGDVVVVRDGALAVLGPAEHEHVVPVELEDAALLGPFRRPEDEGLAH